MAMCGGVLNIGVYANNGGVVRLDLANKKTLLGSFTQADWNENYGEVAGVACDSTDTLYVAFYEDEADIKKYSYSSGSWITQSHLQPTVYRAIECGGMQSAMKTDNLYLVTELGCRATTSSVEDSPLFRHLATQMPKPVSMVLVHL